MPINRGEGKLYTQPPREKQTAQERRMGREREREIQRDTERYRERSRKRAEKSTGISEDLAVARSKPGSPEAEIAAKPETSEGEGPLGWRQDADRGTKHPHVNTSTH